MLSSQGKYKHVVDKEFSDLIHELAALCLNLTAKKNKNNTDLSEDDSALEVSLQGFLPRKLISDKTPSKW